MAQWGSSTRAWCGAAHVRFLGATPPGHAHGVSVRLCTHEPELVLTARPANSTCSSSWKATWKTWDLACGGNQVQHLWGWFPLELPRRKHAAWEAPQAFLKASQVWLLLFPLWG